MMLTPKNITTAELLAFTASVSRPGFVVRTWNANTRKWQSTSDRALIAQSERVAVEKGTNGLGSGDTVFLGEVAGTRVLVEVR